MWVFFMASGHLSDRMEPIEFGSTLVQILAVYHCHRFYGHLTQMFMELIEFGSTLVQMLAVYHCQRVGFTAT